MNKSLLGYCFLIILGSIVNLQTLCSQDVLFSQYNRTPLQVNPAMVGNFNGKARILTGYRNQWAQVLRADSYVAHFLSVDTRVLDKENQALGLGLSTSRDASGENNLGTRSIHIAANYQRKIGNTNQVDHRLLIGVEAGVANRITDDNLSNGAIDFSYSDINMGLAWQSVFQNGNALFVGAAGHHIVGSRRITVSVEQIETRTSRYTVHAGAKIGLSDSWNIVPSFLYVSQGENESLTLGASFRKNYGEAESNKFIQIGVQARTMHSNGVIPSVVLNLERFSLGLSADFSTSTGLQQVGNYDGAAELTLGYIIGKHSTTYKRPIW